MMLAIEFFKKTMCFIGMHKKHTYLNTGLVNGVKMSCEITKCTRCKKFLK